MSEWMRGLRVVLKYRYHGKDDLSGKGCGCVHPRPTKDSPSERLNLDSDLGVWLVGLNWRSAINGDIRLALLFKGRKK